MRPRRFMSVAVVLVALVGTSASGVWLDAGSAAATGPTSIEDVLVDSPSYQAATGAVENARLDIVWSRDQIRSNLHIIEQLESGLQQLDAGLPTLSSKIETSTDLVNSAKDDLADLAVLQYVLKGTDAELLTVTSGATDTEHPAQKALVMDTAMAGHQATLANAEHRRDDAVFAVETARAGRGDLEARLLEAHDALAFAQRLLGETSSRLPHLEGRVANERRRTRVIGSDLSYVALEAYLLGARAANNDNPGCGLEWTVLAGIGRVESRHGTYGGTKLADDGRVEDPIIGIALNGSRETAVVGDSDGGALDGDPIFDRAVGPMQFIPTTWAGFAVDGNADGLRDPQNIYDAARAAGNYLCHSGALDTEGGLRTAILRYNASDVYVKAVLLNAHRYEELGIATW